MLRSLAVTKRILGDALGHFNNDDGWALSSHLALSALMALFPFLIFATALASFLGAQAFADTAVHLVFDTWPDEIAQPIADEVLTVLTVPRGDVLTIGILAAAFFATNGIEALRVGLNRAYRVIDRRSIFWLRAQSLAFVLIATAGFLIVSSALVVAPIAVDIAQRHLPGIRPYLGTITLWRFVIASVVIVLALVVVHMWLPAGRRRLRDIVPGLVFTLVFLYIVSAIFLLGGELNAAIRRYLDARAKVSSLTAG